MEEKDSSLNQGWVNSICGCKLKREESLQPHISVASIKKKVVSEFPPKGYIVSWLLYFVWKDKWPTVRIYINSCQW